MTQNPIPSWKEQLSAYLDGELSREEAAAFEAEMARRPEIQKERNTLLALRRALRALPTPVPGPDFHQRVRPRAPWARRIFPALVGAAAAAGVMLTLWRDDPRPPLKAKDPSIVLPATEGTTPPQNLMESEKLGYSVGSTYVASAQGMDREISPAPAKGRTPASEASAVLFNEDKETVAKRMDSMRGSNAPAKAAPLAKKRAEAMEPVADIVLSGSEGGGSKAAIEEFRTVHVRTEADWKTLWGEIHRRQHQPTPLPTVNFHRWEVVAVFLGTRTSGGYRVSIRRMENTPTERIVFYHETVPPPGSLQTQALTQPFAWRAIPRGDKPLRFQPE